MRFSQSELDDQIKRLDIDACRRRKMHHERVVSAQHAVYAQGLRWRRPE